MRPAPSSSTPSVLLAGVLVLAAGLGAAMVASDQPSAGAGSSASTLANNTTTTNNTTTATTSTTTATTTTTTTVTTTTTTTETTSTTTQTTTTTRSDENETGENETVEVEFINCSAFRVTAHGQRVEVGTTTYDPELATYIRNYGSINGTEIIDPNSSRLYWNVATSYVSVGEMDPDVSVSASNPNGSECVKKSRPDKPTLNVASTERVNESAIEVTFQYHNPNGGMLPSRVVFYDQVVSGETPDRLRPGNHTFTVVWQPANESAQLTWAVGMSQYGYVNETVRATTQPAGSIGDSDNETTPTTTRTTTTDTTTSPTPTDDDSSSDSGGSAGGTGGGSAPTTTWTTQTTPSTSTTTPTRTTDSPTPTTTTETRTTSRTTVTTAASNESANATTATVRADPSEPGEGGTFARIDSSTAIQGVSFGVTAVFAALALVAWRRH